jgi:DNA-binding transcriptional LysR family regulator
MSLLVRAGHPALQGSPANELRKYPLISPGQFKSIEGWPRYCRPYLSGPLHVIEDYGVAARLTEVTDAIWLCSTYAAAPEISAARLQEIPPPAGQRAVRFRMMLYSLDRRSLSPAALMLKGLFHERIRALGAEI